MAINHAQFQTMLQEVGELFRAALVEFGRETSTKNVIALVNGIKDNALGDFSETLSTRAAAWRTRYAALVAGDEFRSLLDPIFAALLRDLVDNRGNLDPDSNWGQVYEYFRATGPYRLASRGITFDTTPTASGTGSGQVFRLTQDRFGQTIEGVTVPLDITFRCVTTDPDSVGEEVFEITTPSPTDILDRGSGVSFDPNGSIQGINSDGEFLSDHSFQLATAAVADPSDLGAWQDTTDTYGSARYALVTTTALSSIEELRNGQALALEVKGNHTIQQDLTGIDLFTPYIWSLRVSRNGTITTGTLRVHWGSQTQDIDLTATSASPTFDLENADLDSGLFGWNFAGDAGTAKFKLEVLNLTGGGSVYIDNVRFRAMDFFGGTYWAVESDATNFQSGTNEKKLVFGDALAGSDSVLQQMIYIAYGRYLPTSGGTLVPDP